MNRHSWLPLVLTLSLTLTIACGDDDDDGGGTTTPTRGLPDAMLGTWVETGSESSCTIRAGFGDTHTDTLNFCEDGLNDGDDFFSCDAQQVGNTITVSCEGTNTIFECTYSYDISATVVLTDADHYALTAHAEFLPGAGCGKGAEAFCSDTEATGVRISTTPDCTPDDPDDPDDPDEPADDGVTATITGGPATINFSSSDELTQVGVVGDRILVIASSTSGSSAFSLTLTIPTPTSVPVTYALGLDGDDDTVGIVYNEVYSPTEIYSLIAAAGTMVITSYDGTGLQGTFSLTGTAQVGGSGATSSRTVSGGEIDVTLDNPGARLTQSAIRQALRQALR